MFRSNLASPVDKAPRRIRQYGAKWLSCKICQVEIRSLVVGGTQDISSLTWASALSPSRGTRHRNHPSVARAFKARRAALDGVVLTVRPTRILASACNTPSMGGAERRKITSRSPSSNKPRRTRSASDVVPVVLAMCGPPRTTAIRISRSKDLPHQSTLVAECAETQLEGSYSACRIPNARIGQPPPDPPSRRGSSFDICVVEAP